MGCKEISQKKDFCMDQCRFLHLLNPGEEGVIDTLPDNELLPSLSMRPGKKIKILAKSLAGGPVVVCVDRRTIAIDRKIAGKIGIACPCASNKAVNE